MRVLPLEPFGGDVTLRTDASARWDDTTPAAVREAAADLLPFRLKSLKWSEDADLGPVGLGRSRRGELRLLVVVEVLDAQRFVAGLARVARALPEERVERAALVVLADRVTQDVQGAVALVGPGAARVFLVELDESPPPSSSSSSDPSVADTPAGGSHLTSARGRRRGRPAVPALAPREQLSVVAALVGEAELALDGTEGQIRGVLNRDGVIEVSGRRYEDPLEAAVAHGREVSDGWAAWRFGVDGPYLGEALEEALNPQRRPKRPPRRRPVTR